MAEHLSTPLCHFHTVPCASSLGNVQECAGKESRACQAWVQCLTAHAKVGLAAGDCPRPGAKLTAWNGLYPECRENNGFGDDSVFWLLQSHLVLFGGEADTQTDRSAGWHGTARITGARQPEIRRSLHGDLHQPKTLQERHGTMILSLVETE